MITPLITTRTGKLAIFPPVNTLIRTQSNNRLRFGNLNQNSNVNQNQNTRAQVAQDFVMQFNKTNKNTNSVASKIADTVIKVLSYALGNMMIEPLRVAFTQVVNYITHPKTIAKVAVSLVNNLAEAFDLPKPLPDIEVDLSQDPEATTQFNVNPSETTKNTTSAMGITAGDEILEFLKAKRKEPIELLEAIPLARGAKAEIARRLTEHRDAILDLVDIPYDKMSAAQKIRTINLKSAESLEWTLNSLKNHYPQEFKKQKVQDYMVLINKWVRVLRGLQSCDTMQKVSSDVKALMADVLIDTLKDSNPDVRQAGYAIGKQAGLSVADMNRALKAR